MEVTKGHCLIVASQKLDATGYVSRLEKIIFIILLKLTQVNSTSKLCVPSVTVRFTKLNLWHLSK